MSMLLTTGAAATVTGGRMAGVGRLSRTSLQHPRSNVVSVSLLGRGTLGYKSRASQPPLATAASSASSVVEESESELRRMRYHCAKFMLDEEEHFKELLFERLRSYGEGNKRQDFWLVIEPKFLEGFPGITRRLRRPALALVSTDATWITFMKSRLDRVLCNSYEADTVEQALPSNATQLKFDKPEVWTAPYPKYEYGWWEPFLSAAGLKKPIA